MLMKFKCTWQLGAFSWAAALFQHGVFWFTWLWVSYVFLHIDLSKCSKNRGISHAGFILIPSQYIDPVSLEIQQVTTLIWKMLLGEMMHRFKTTIQSFSCQKQNVVTLTWNPASRLLSVLADVLELHVLLMSFAFCPCSLGHAHPRH